MWWFLSVGFNLHRLLFNLNSLKSFKEKQSYILYEILRHFTWEYKYRLISVCLIICKISYPPITINSHDRLQQYNTQVQLGKEIEQFNSINSAKEVGHTNSQKVPWQSNPGVGRYVFNIWQKLCNKDERKSLLDQSNSKFSPASSSH